MANAELLARAYSAFDSLVSDGATKISVSSVAKLSGVARATINQRGDEEWRTLREKIRAHAASFDALNKVEKDSSIYNLRLRVKALETQVRLTREKAADTYSQLIDRVQYYYALASDTPKANAEKAKLIKELSSERKRNQELRAQLDLALASSTSPAVATLTVKRILRPVEFLSRADITDDVIKKLYEFRKHHSGARIVEVFVICGLPLAGAEKWITEHNPVKPGVSLYIECNCVTREIRRFLVTLLSKEFEANIHCVLLRTSKESCLSRAAMRFSGAEQVLAIKKIETLSSLYEEVGLDENFSSIIMV